MPHWIFSRQKPGEKEHVVRSQCPLWRHSARFALPVEHGEGSHVFLQKLLDRAGFSAVDVAFMPFHDFLRVNNALITYFASRYWCLGVLHFTQVFTQTKCHNITNQQLYEHFLRSVLKQTALCVCESAADACSKLRATLLRAQQKQPGCEKEAAEPLRSALTLARERESTQLEWIVLFLPSLCMQMCSGGWKCFFGGTQHELSVEIKGPENIWSRKSS